jgi:SSS family solute:Na+ symporter
MTPDTINWTALTVFILFFALVTVLGFFASRWRAGDLSQLHEWGLGGRRFGTIITWFLVGGDFYTAYTVIAVPGLVYAVGAYGFFALPYTIIVYPLVFLIMPRLWAVCHKHQYVTGADFVHGRYGSEWLALAVALTGLLATMPYIALQLVGMQVVIGALGIGGEGFTGELPLIIAFVILAVYTYSSGLRAPAMIAFVKDAMIYVVVIAAVAIIPLHLGGYAAVFDAADKAFQAKGGATGIILQPGQFIPFATLALGSAFAAFMYPHTMTGVLSSSSGDVVRKNAMLLPAYTLLLGLIAMLGYMAIAAGISVCSSRSSRIGSSVSASPRSRSAHWCRRRSCRSAPPISLRATSGASSSTRISHRPPRRRPPSSPRWSSNSARWSSSSGCRRNMRSICNYSAVSGFCRPFRRSCLGCTRPGSVPPLC